MDKLIGSAAAAVADTGDCTPLAAGGSGLSGIPAALTGTLPAARDLNVVPGNRRGDDRGRGRMLPGEPAGTDCAGIRTARSAGRLERNARRADIIF